jgi:hypothetical protein
MNRKQFTLILVLLVVLGLAGLLIYRHSQSSWQTTNQNLGQKLLGDFPVNDVGRIAIKQDTNELNLVKKDDVWRVQERNNYPANYSEISGFLLKARDLKIVQSEKVGASQLPKLALAPGQGTNSPLVVDFKDQKDKTIKTLLLGKKQMKKNDRPSPYGDFGEGWAVGRWVKAGNDSGDVMVINDALANIEPKPEQWLDKDFFKIEKVRAVAVTFPVATNSWKFTRDTEAGEWKLADAKPTEQLDAAKASSAGNPFNNASFNDVAANEKPADLDANTNKPTVAAIETFDNFTYTIKVGQKTNENYPLAMTVAAEIAKERTPGKDEKPEDKDKLDKEFKEKQKKLEDKLAQEKKFENWVYLVSNWTVDQLLKERSQLLKEEPKKDEKSNASIDPPKIEGQAVQAVQIEKKTEPPPAPPPVADPPKKDGPPKSEQTAPPPTTP